MKSGIYVITNKTNAKVYIGQSVDIDKRFNSHRCYLRNGNHYNEHLQRAFNLYGEQSFSFDVLEYCDLDCIDEKEIHYIKLYSATNDDFGYNISLGGHEGTRIHSEETRQKISQALKGRPLSDETKAKMSKNNGKRIWTEQQKIEAGKKFREYRTNRKPSNYIEPSVSMVYDAFSQMPSKQFLEKHGVCKAYYYKFRKRIGAI
jgi:group I intron endonuclease